MGDYSVRLVHLVHFRYLCYNSIANYLRRKKLKRVGIFGLTAIIVLLSFGAYAQESGVRELSLKESVKLVLENNLDLKSAEYQLGLTEAEYEEAQINNLLNTSIVTLKTAELSLKRAQDSLEETRKQLVLEDVISGYFQVVKAEQKIQIEEASLEESQQNLEMVKNKFSLGDANQLDVMQAEIGLSLAQLNLTQAVNDLTLAKMNFNQVLGLPLETQFKLTDTFSLETSEEILEDSIQKALDNRYEIAQARYGVELARLKWELTQNDYTAELKKKKAFLELEGEKLDLEQLKTRITLEITQLFLDLGEKETNVEVTRKQEKEKEETYHIAQAQYKAGLITTTDLLDSQIQFTDAQIKSLEALFNYNLAHKQFIRALGIELEKTQEKSSASVRE